MFSRTKAVSCCFLWCVELSLRARMPLRCFTEPATGTRCRLPPALSLSPAQGHVGLHYRTYCNGYVNVAAYASFLRELLQQVHSPLVLVQDRGNMHRGDPMRLLQKQFPRLDVNLLPPYAPELNPVEQLWNFAKDKELSNFVPHDVAESNTVLQGWMDNVRHDQHRLRSFFAATPLPWNSLTVFF